MIVFLLFIINFIITACAYTVSRRKCLNLTFLSSAMFSLFAFLYIVFYSYIGRDLSLEAFVLIIASEIMIALGERIGNIKILFGNNRVNSYEIHDSELLNEIVDLKVSIPRTLFLFVVTVGVAVLRYYRLYQYLGSMGISAGLYNVVSMVRVDYSHGEVSLGAALSAAYYMCLIIGYIYAFLFVFSIVVTKKRKLYLLLPVLGYALCVVTTTSRVEYIKLACAFVVSAFALNIYKKKRKINFMKIGAWACLFAAFFLWYGFSIRGVTNEGITSVFKNIVNYTSASLYGLDEYILKPWAENSYFGQYTLNNIYSQIGHESMSTYEPFFWMANAKSNIYTSLVKPIQDYGIFGMLLTRLLMTLISCKIQEKYIATNICNKSYFLWFIMECHVVYTYVCAPIGDKAYLFFLNPKYIIELIVSFYIALLIGLKFSYVYSDGSESEVSIRYLFRKNSQHNSMKNESKKRGFENENLLSNCDL